MFQECPQIVLEIFIFWKCYFHLFSDEIWSKDLQSLEPSHLIPSRFESEPYLTALFKKMF